MKDRDLFNVAVLLTTRQRLVSDLAKASEPSALDLTMHNTPLYRRLTDEDRVELSILARTVVQRELDENERALADLGVKVEHPDLEKEDFEA